MRLARSLLLGCILFVNEFGVRRLETLLNDCVHALVARVVPFFRYPERFQAG